MSIQQNMVILYYFVIHFCRISFQRVVDFFGKRMILKKECAGENWIEEYTIWSETEMNDFGFLDDHFVYEEVYVHHLLNDIPFAQIVDEEYTAFKRKASSNKNNFQSVFIAKHSSGYYQVFDAKNKNTFDDIQKSLICFVYVEYNHPRMHHSIELNIPSNYFLVGNKLLTSAFVLRLLQQANVFYVFDTDYTLRILDHELNEKQLDFWEYVEIQESLYIIK